MPKMISSDYLFCPTNSSNPKVLNRQETGNSSKFLKLERILFSFKRVQIPKVL